MFGKKKGAPIGNRNAAGARLFGGLKVEAKNVDTARRTADNLYKKYGSDVGKSLDFGFKNVVSYKTGKVIPASDMKAFNKANDKLYSHSNRNIVAKTAINAFRKTK